MQEQGAVDVAVVGGGLAGLTAADRLARAGLRVRVLEARDRVGGRTHTVRSASGLALDVGGQWVGPTQARVLALIAELGLTTFPTHDAGRHLLHDAGVLRRYAGALPSLHPLTLLDLLQLFWRLDRAARSVPLDAPWSAAHAARWDGQTLASWLQARTHTAGAARVAAQLGPAVFGSDAGALGLLHVLHYVHSAGGLEALVSVSGGAQEQRVLGGTQQLSLGLAARLGDAVRLGSPVRRIVQHAGGVELTGDAGCVRARRAIVAIPPTLAGRIDYSPSLPAARDQLLQRMPQGSVIKVQVVYARPFWREQGLSGQVLSTGAPLSPVFDNSPPDGSAGVLVGFFEARHAVELGGLAAEARQRVALDALALYFGPQAARPLEYVERDWCAEEWTRGCYGAHLPPGAWTTYGAALRTPVGRLHWAGTETAEVWTGYMEGAIRSGERAAAEVEAVLARDTSASAQPRQPVLQLDRG